MQGGKCEIMRNVEDIIGIGAREIERDNLIVAQTKCLRCGGLFEQLIDDKDDDKYRFCPRCGEVLRWEQ